METSFFKKMISISFLFIFMFTMNVQAKEVIYTGNGQNLQKFIDDNVESGDTVKLTSPSYTFSTLEIKKDLTLEGVGNAEWSTSSGIKNYPTTRITGEIIIKDSAENVVLKNIFMQNGKVTQSDLSIIKVTTQVNLTLDNFANHYVTGNTVDNVNTLNLDEGSDNSKVIVKNSILIPLYDVFLVEAGDIKFNIDNCYLTGKRIFDFDASSNAQNNSLTINNSYLEGTAATNAAKIKTDEVIAIKNQDKLTIDINNSTLVGEKVFSSSSPTHIFDFEGENSNVTINIKDNSILRDSDERDSNIFKFGQSKKNSNNVINVDNTVKMTKEEDDETFTIKDKYSIDSVDSVVVGIYDFTGNLTVKVYDKNDVLKSELDEIVKKIPKNYRFIGWYTDKEFIEDKVFEVSTPVSENIDLYPKTIELITVTIKDQEFIIDKGSNLNSLKEDDKQRLENVLKADDKQFKDFVIEGQEDRYTKESIESVTLIPKYTVDVTIKEEGSQDVFHKITLDDGQSLKDVSSEDTTYSNLINDIYFNCFYKENQKFDTDTPIDKNIELTIKRNVKVSVNSNDHYVLKDSKLSDDNELNKALEELAKGTNKQFKKYYDNTNKREIEAQSKADMDMEIIAQFTVDVTIDKEKFTIDEGQTLNDIKGEDLDRLNTLKNGEYFSRYLKDNETFDEKTPINENTTLKVMRNVKITIKSDSQSTEKYIEEGSILSSSKDIINALKELGNVQHKHLKEYYNETEKRHITFKDLETYQITKDSVIVGRYEVKVTIEEDGETKRVITIDEKNNLSSASGDDKKYLEDLKDDPYFAGFIKGSDEFNMDTEVSEDITISIKRNVKITINGTDYYLEKGKNFGESSSILDALKELSNVKDKALKHYYNETDHSPILFDEVESFIATKDIVITPRYTVEVTIIDGNENKVIIIDENQGLETATSEDKEYLDNLVNDDLYFSRFVDEDGNTFTTNTPVTHDITLKVMRNNKVTIAGKDYYLEKGLKLSEKVEITNALETLKNVQGKHFKEYYVGEDVITKDYKPTKDIVIKAHYTVVVTIDGEEFTIDEGESIKDIKGADLERLNKLKNGKYFASYLKDGQEFADSTAISEDTTLTIKRNVKVVVNDTEFYVLKDSKLCDDTNLNNALEELAKGTNKQFKTYYDVTNERIVDIQSKADKDMVIVAQFTVNVVIDGETFTIDEGKSIKDIEGSDLERLNTLKNGIYFSRYLKDNETFKEDTKIMENTTLTIKRNVKVIIEDKDYYVEDGLKLKDNADVVKALEAAKNLATKQFMEFCDVDTQEKIEDPLELEAKEDLKIKARYKIDVKINGKDYILEENSTLESLPLDAKEELQKMREVSNKQFVKFIDKNGNDVDFNKTLLENLEIIPTYNVKVTIDDEEFIIPEGKSLKDIEGSDLERLNTLKNGKYFSRYLKDNETFKEDTKITENTILTIKRNVKVVIDKDYYLEKGNKLSSDKAIVDALKGLKKVTNKQFKEYVKDDKVLENPLELVANDDMVITANYEIEVTIDDKKYTLQEGQSLNDLEKEVLDKLKEIMKKDTFAKFVNSKNEEILLDTKLMENTTINAKYNVLVKIGDDKFIVTEGMTLNDLSKEDKLRLEELKNNHAESLKFKGYKNVKTGEEFTDKTPITSDIELELVFEEIKEEEPTPEVKPDDKPTTDETDKPDTNKPSNPSNDVPKTFDNIITYIVLGITSLITLIGGVFFIRRKSLNK